MTRLRDCALIAAAFLLLPAVSSAQLRGRDLTDLDAANQGRGRGPVGKTPKESAPIDLTGYWVSIVSEDWRFRMLTPPKGDHPDFLLTPEGTKLADAWDPVKDEASKDLPIIVISGHATVNDAVQAIKLGAADFFEKPLNRERVLVSVRNVLEAAKARRALAEVSLAQLQR